ncbi:MAG: cbb3-type cytochrome c oxidase subunit I [Nitrospira sp.]|nr:cbb3-type cytochrome c oxidase subunit I [Nitrospira sp.]
MTHWHIRPATFWLTGLLWLLLSSALGLALFLGTMLGRPLPSVFRVLHVHSALVGGVAQIILGALLSFIPPLLMTGRDRPESHPVLFLAINGGTVGMLAGFAAGHSLWVGAAGILVVLAFLSLVSDALRQVRSSLISPPLNLWFYGVAVLALLVGLGMGEAMALRLLPQDILGQGRLAHIHLNVLGFVTLTIVGTMHNLFPTVLNAPLYSPRLARATFALLPLGILLLIAGFLFSLLPLTIAAGAVILAGVLLYSYNILRTWLKAGRPQQIAVAHFMMATLFLVIATSAGLFVAVNASWTPPLMPFGTLHLVAYTHLALVGFILQTIVGALSHLLPINLALHRVKSNKKRGPYLAELAALAERWRPLQVGALSLGAIGLAFVATLVWQFSLNETPVQIAAWTSAALLGLGLAIVGLKVIRLFLHQPAAHMHE